jgi:hypothetical protein
LVRWISDNRYLLGVVLIVFGIALGLIGKHLFKISICLIGSLAFTLIATLFIFSVFLSRDTSDSTGWIIFGVCGKVGIFVGLVLAYHFRLGVGVLAGWGGFCLGLILYNTFIYKIDNESGVAFWIVCILLAIAAAALTFYFFWECVIISTSIVGAYCLMRGISFYAGGFPDEMEVYYRISKGDLASMPGSFYGYMTGFIILAICFSVFQFKRYGRTHDDHPHPYHRYGK